MVTREKLVEEIEKTPDEHLEELYRMIKSLEVNLTDAESAEGVLDGSYLHMSSIRERVQRESIAQLQIRDRLAPLANLIDRLDSLYDRALNAIADNPEPRAATSRPYSYNPPSPMIFGCVRSQAISATAFRHWLSGEP